MNVIRCENLAGHGPFADHHFQDEFDFEHRHMWVLKHNDDNHPVPMEDDIPIISLRGHPNAGWQSGFSCLEQMYNWFAPDERIDLVNSGFRFVWLKTNGKILYGHKQLVFHRPTAKLIGPVENVL